MLDVMVPPGKYICCKVTLVTSAVTGSQVIPLQVQMGLLGTDPVHDQSLTADMPVEAAKSHIAKAAFEYTARLGVNNKINNMRLTVAARVLITQMCH
jgi:hypothetical protein